MAWADTDNPVQPNEINEINEIKSGRPRSHSGQIGPSSGEMWPESPDAAFASNAPPTIGAFTCTLFDRGQTQLVKIGPQWWQMGQPGQNRSKSVKHWAKKGGGLVH